MPHSKTTNTPQKQWGLVANHRPLDAERRNLSKPVQKLQMKANEYQARARKAGVQIGGRGSLSQKQRRVSCPSGLGDSSPCLASRDAQALFFS